MKSTYCRCRLQRPSNKNLCKVLCLLSVLVLLFWLISNTAYYITVKSCLGLSSHDFHLYCDVKAPLQHSNSKKELTNAIMDELVHLQKDITKARRHSRGGVTTRTLMQAHTRLEILMKSLDENNQASSEQNSALIESSSENPYVCPELYHGTTAGYPLYYEGWDIAPCEGIPPLNEVVTILLNLQSYHKPANAAATILGDLEKVHTGLTVLIAINEEIDTTPYKLVIKQFPGTQAPGVVWNTLIAQVTTPYLLIGRDIERITSDIRLERLIRVANSFDINVVGGAIRTPNGHWSSACRQLMLRNYTLAYIEGYDVSRNACMYCEHLLGPFLANTDVMKKINFFRLDSFLTDDVLFEDFFINLKTNGKHSMSCPDSMYLVHETDSRKEIQSTWLPLIKKHEINHIHLHHGKILRFSCEEADTPCKPKAYAGRAIPICCLETMAHCINLFLKLSDEKQFVIKIDSGNVLGSVKFHGILPWERDADIDYSNFNHSVIGNFETQLAAGGCILKEEHDPKKDSYGYYSLKVAGWRIELWGTNHVPTEREILKGWNLTRVFTHGYWQPLPFNPGYYGRARYGYDIYKHVQHWQTLKKKNSWYLYKPGHFTPCSKPGHHSCLDNFLPDGNIQFKVPW